MEQQTGWTRDPWPEIMVALISGVVFVLAHFRALANPFIINDDVRQQLYWMQQWQDPALFPDDFLTGYARHYVTWGVKGLYWLASWWVSPLTFSKLLPGFLFVFLAFCLFKIGTRLADRQGDEQEPGEELGKGQRGHPPGGQPVETLDSPGNVGPCIAGKEVPPE